MIERLSFSGRPWKKVLSEADIIYLHSPEGIRNVLRHYKILTVSRCSKTKSQKTGTPKEFYVSPQNLSFYEWCERHKLRYGILSDLYGLHLDNEVKEYYDIHPSKVSDAEFARLAAITKEKMVALGYQGFLYFNSSPIMSAPYFYLMRLTGLKIFYITKLHNLDRRSIWQTT